MGTDKGTLEFEGASLLERSVSLLAGVVADVFVGINRRQVDDPLRSCYPCIVDDERLTGPAASLIAAHEYRPDHAWLIVACDMPGLSAALVNLLAESRDASYSATAYVAEGRPEPLCAIYEPDSLARLVGMIGAGNSPGPSSLLGKQHVRHLPLPPGADLASVNDPEQYRQWLGRTRQDRESRQNEIPNA
jgi:molybdopterin-guanine dinucleotide biosynthesis protein A